MIRFATIGTNFIVDWFVQAARQCPEYYYAAVYSRNRDTAVSFAKKHNVPRITGDLKALAEDPDIDAVYIASPNALHFSQSALLLTHKKHVLCEKPVTSNAAELQELDRLARQNGVVLLEAIRSAYDPGLKAVGTLLPQLGTLRRVSFEFGKYSSRYDHFKEGILDNAFRPELSNAAVMDIGVYSIHPLIRLFGYPRKIYADSILLSNGFEGAGTILAHYDGMLADLKYSKITDSMPSLQIQGEDGVLVIDDLVAPRELTVCRRGERPAAFSVEGVGRNENMVYELREWGRLITSGEENPHTRYSMMTMQMIDEVRKQTGIIFPADQEVFPKS